MKTIPSFQIDHNILKKGIYISRIDDDITTYDIRMRKPNREPVMTNAAMHTIEHLFATYVRNTEFGDNIIYFGPMGCRTGFYFLTRSLSDNYSINLDREFKMTCVSMGNPHAVMFIDEHPKDFDLEKYGKACEGNTNVFPDRVNAEFAKIIDRNNIEMRVYERGSGETLACGTGSCATAVAAITLGLCDNDVTIHLLGGDLDISWSGDVNDSVFMTGPAKEVFTGEVDLNKFD